MKTKFQNPLVVPVLVLLVSAILGGLPPVAMKIALREISSPMIVFLRVSMMVPIFFFLSWNRLGLIRSHWKMILPISLGWAGNMILFSVGIPHTTAPVSQVIYTAVPVIIAALSPFLLHESPTLYQIIGIGIGFIGTLITVFGDGGAITGGNAFGNIFVVFAASSWALYIIATRKFKTNVPVSVNLLVGSFIVWIFFALSFMTGGGFILPTLSASTIYALVFLGLIGGVLMFFTHQWGAQRSPAIMSGSTGYVSVVAAIIASWIILGERLEIHEWVGLILLLAAVMLTTTIPLLIRRRAGRMV